MQRGGKPESEILHGEVLSEAGALETWGWGTKAGWYRVRQRADFLIESCRLKPGVNVLECGCGVGLFSKLLAQTGANITAVDISPKLLEMARKYCALPNVTFIEDNLEAPVNLPDGHFDVVCGISVLHHLSVVPSLTALKPKLRSDALFAFSEPNILNPLNKYYYCTPDLEKRKARKINLTEMAFSPNELRDLLQESGYIVDGLLQRDFLPSFTPDFLIPLVRSVGWLFERIPVVNLWSGTLQVYGHLP
jgi:SAM-dependent methyltransferase